MSKSIKDLLKEKYGTDYSIINKVIKRVRGSFTCEFNSDITSLEGCPREVDGNFTIYDLNLDSLKGCPSHIWGNFTCNGCKLNSLKGGPTKVEYWYDCSNNNLNSLQGAPKEVTDFDCSFNDLKSLEGCPKIVYGNFWCDNQKNHKFTEDEIRSVCKVSGQIRC